MRPGRGLNDVVALIAAAGASRRLGRPKQLELFAGEMLLARSVRVAREAGCRSITVVLGADADRIRAECDLSGCEIVHHNGWAEGVGSSIAAGARALGTARGVLVLTCDMPSVAAEHLRALSATGDLAASAYRHSLGVPAFFPQLMFAQLAELRGDHGAKDLLRSAVAVALPGGEIDVDTQEDLEEARKVFATPSSAGPAPASSRGPEELSDE